MVSSRQEGRLLLSLSHTCTHAHTRTPRIFFLFLPTFLLQKTSNTSWKCYFLPNCCLSVWLAASSLLPLLGSAPTVHGPSHSTCAVLATALPSLQKVLGWLCWGCWALPGGANSKLPFASNGVHLTHQSCSRCNKAKPSCEVMLRGYICPAVLSRMPWRSCSPGTCWKMPITPYQPALPWGAEL